MPNLTKQATITNTPRNPILGLLADAIQPVANSGLLGEFLLGKSGKVLDDMSYGYSPTTGRGMTTGVKPDAVDLLNLTPLAGAVKPLGKLAGRELARQVQTGTGVGKYMLDPRINALPPDKYLGKQLAGLDPVVMVNGKPELFGTDQRIVDIAKQITSDIGKNYIEQPYYAEVDVERAKRIAKAFERMKDNPNDPKVKKAYEAMIDETVKQYEALRRAGYKFDFMPESGDIYGNPRNAINDIVLNKKLSVFPTEQGFGTINEASNLNPLLIKTGEFWNGKPVLANDLFRAVHDVMGHAKHGVGFRARGEENAFQSHARMYSDDALPAVTSETRGQNSFVNFGPYAEKNKTANPSETIYADQKIGLLPDWVSIEGLLK